MRSVLGDGRESLVVAWAEVQAIPTAATERQQKGEVATVSIDVSQLPEGIDVMTTKPRHKPFVVSKDGTRGLPADVSDRFARRFCILLQHGAFDHAKELLREAARELGRRRRRPTDVTNLVDLLPLRTANLLSKHGIDTLGDLRANRERLATIPLLGQGAIAAAEQVLLASDEGDA
jgi:hypothetical protein